MMDDTDRAIARIEAYLLLVVKDLGEKKLRALEKQWDMEDECMTDSEFDDPKLMADIREYRRKEREQIRKDYFLE